MYIYSRIWKPYKQK